MTHHRVPRRQAGAGRARGHGVDAVVLDLMLPGISGTDVCRRLRAEGNDVPILMLTARGAVPERVAGLDAGADDYLVKPFALEELAARLHAIRRRRESPDHRLTWATWCSTRSSGGCGSATSRPPVSRREFAMLVTLMENAGRVVSRDTLFDEMWDGEVDIRSNAIDVHMSRLRARLEPSTQREGDDAARRRVPARDRRPVRVWHRLVGRRPIVTRLVVAVAAAMAVVLVLAAAFVYWRVAFALDRQVDQDLDAYQEVVEHAVSTGQPPPEDTPGEAFQVYDERGRLVAGNDRLPSLLDAERLADLRGGQEIRFDVGSFLPPADLAYRVDAFRVTSPSGTRYVASAISRASTTRRCASCCCSSRSPTWRRSPRRLRRVPHRARRAGPGGALPPYRRAAGARLRRAARPAAGRHRPRRRADPARPHVQRPARPDRGAGRRERQFLADASHGLALAAVADADRAGVAPAPAPLRGRDRDGARLDAGPGGPARRPGERVARDRGAARHRWRCTREAVAVDELVAAAVRGVPEATYPGWRWRPRPPWWRSTVGGPSWRWRTWCLNGLRHGEGPVRVVADVADGRLVVTVSDQGPGFPDAFVDQAFDRFSRAEESRSTPGSGLGLSLVQAVARAHGGEASIEPTAAGGRVRLDAPGVRSG